MATKAADKDSEAVRQRTAARAYAIWESEGRPHGRDVQHWNQAQAEITGGGRSRKMPPKVAAAMTAAAGEGRTTRASSKTAAKKSSTGTRKKS